MEELDPWLAHLTTFELKDLLAQHPQSVALLPVGSTEPHGPHLPLCTDVTISEGASRRAVKRLRSDGVFAGMLPPIAYGVTDFAEGFCGALSLPADVLVAQVEHICRAVHAQGFSLVCVVNNHLEPAHHMALSRAVKACSNIAIMASPLSRRWGRTLDAEYKSGACHAGSYETSLVLAEKPALVRESHRKGLPALEHSLSKGIAEGITTFQALGMSDAYTGDPKQATAAHGETQYARLGDMICTEVSEFFAKAAISTNLCQSVGAGGGL